MKKVLFGIIIGGIIFGSLGVLAGSYNAKQISYTPRDSNWNVHNINDAIDELHNTKKLKKKVVASFVYAAGNVMDSYYGIKSFDIREEIPNYNLLTIDNFCLQVNDVSISLPGGSNVNASNANLSIVAYENGVITVDLQNTVRSGASPYMHISIIAFYTE